MKQPKPLYLAVVIVAVLVCSCTASSKFLQALKIDDSSSPDSISATRTSKTELEKQLAAAQKREISLKKRVAALEQKIGTADAQFNSQLTEFKREFSHREVALNKEIRSLKK